RRYIILVVCTDKYGRRNITQLWIEAFLTGRYQYQFWRQCTDGFKIWLYDRTHISDLFVVFQYIQIRWQVFFRNTRGDYAQLIKCFQRTYMKHHDPRRIFE